MSTQLRVIVTGLAFIAIFIFGFWLSRSGKPYNGLIFNAHKLVALGMLVFLGLTISKVSQITPLTPTQIALIAATGLCFLAVMATGGMISAAKTTPVMVRWLHQILPYLTVLSTAAALYLLLFKNGEIIPLQAVR
jgi:hypothetical protein